MDFALVCIGIAAFSFGGCTLAMLLFKDGRKELRRFADDMAERATQRRGLG